MSPAETVTTKFDESVPRLLQRDMLRSVLACYQQADKFAKRHYPPTEAMVVRGHIRRADIEVDIRGVAEKYIGAEANPQPNRTNSAFHSVVRIGDVKLTQSKLANPKKMARPSAFREEYAVESAQYVLAFVEKRKKKIVTIEGDHEYLFAVLIHGCKRQDKSRPCFVRFAFPNKECSEWITQIDLMKRFPDVLSEFYAPIAAAEAQERRVRLKKGIRKGGKEKRA